MSQDKKARLLEAAAKAKAEIDAQLNRFMEKLDKASDDPSLFITMSQLELELHDLSHSTNQRYRDLLAESMSIIDTKELVHAKKACSSRKGLF